MAISYLSVKHHGFFVAKKVNIGYNKARRIVIIDAYII